MRQVAVASYAVGTHTAAGGLDEDGQKTAQSGPTTQACSVLTVPWSYTVHSSTSSLQESCLACTSFPLGGLEEGPNGPDDQADSRWLSPETTTTKARRMDLPARPHLISLLSPVSSGPLSLQSAAAAQGKARVNGRLPPAAGAGRREFMWHPVSSPFRPACVCKERTTKLEGSGRAREWKQPRRHPT